MFYGIEPVPDGERRLIVHGNCQAESLRIALAGPDLVSVRIPPVHELTVADMPRLRELLAETDVLISQPVRRAYRGLPVGTEEIATQLPPRARLLRVPVIRFCGLYPTQALIRPPADRSVVPPVVPYHDLAVLAEAAGRPLPGRLPAPVIRAVAEHSRQELRRRESAHATVRLADLFDAPAFEQMRTINHPGNAVLEPVARRVRRLLGLTPGGAIGRPLLDGVHAPRSEAVISALGLEVDPEPAWIVGGRRIDPEEVRAAHLEWYGRHPDAVAEGLRRHAPVLELLSGAR